MVSTLEKCESGRGAVGAAGPFAVEAAMAQELVTGGRERRLQKRAQRSDGWTAERRATFLDHLAATCNVTRATRAAGMGNNSVYALRQRDETFAAQWRAALSAGYERLEAMLIERATLGVRAESAEALLGEAPVPDPATMDIELAKWLLSRHGAREGGKPRAPGGRVTRATEAETDAALVRQLKALGKRAARP